MQRKKGKKWIGPDGIRPKGKKKKKLEKGREEEDNRGGKAGENEVSWGERRVVSTFLRIFAAKNKKKEKENGNKESGVRGEQCLSDAMPQGHEG
jgi:hypothetical protein